MKIDVTELLQETGTEARVKGEDKIKVPKDELEIVGPIKYDLKLLNSGVSVLVKGQVEAEIILTCGRCLKNFNKKITVDIDEQFSKNAPEYKKTGGQIELYDKDFVYQISDDNTIDMGEVMRQNLLTALPIKAICSKNCNIEKSEKGKKIDPRLEKLKELLPKSRS